MEMKTGEFPRENSVDAPHKNRQNISDETVTDYSFFLLPDGMDCRKFFASRAHDYERPADARSGQNSYARSRRWHLRPAS